jgi:hypothetical protein
VAEVGVAVIGAAVVVVVVLGVDVMSATVVADDGEDAGSLEVQPDTASATVTPRQGGMSNQRTGAPIRS